MSNKKTNNKPANNKISLFGEMSMMSVAAIVCLIILVICCVAFYLYMSSSPKKHVVVDDDARIFTTEQEHELEELAQPGLALPAEALEVVVARAAAHYRAHRYRRDLRRPVLCPAPDPEVGFVESAQA